jgi:hypothetical protein
MSEAEWTARIHRRVDLQLIANGLPPLHGTPWHGDSFQTRADAAIALDREFPQPPRKIAA